MTARKSGNREIQDALDAEKEAIDRLKAQQEEQLRALRERHQKAIDQIREKQKQEAPYRRRLDDAKQRIRRAIDDYQDGYQSMRSQFGYSDSAMNTKGYKTPSAAIRLMMADKKKQHTSHAPDTTPTDAMNPDTMNTGAAPQHDHQDEAGEWAGQQ